MSPHVRSLRVTLCPPKGLISLGTARREIVRGDHHDPMFVTPDLIRGPWIADRVRNDSLMKAV